MAMTTIEIRGADQIMARLRQLPEKVGKRAGKRALRKGAIPIRDAARRNARSLDDPRTQEAIYKNITIKGSSPRYERAGPRMRVGILGGARDMRKYGEFKGQGKGNPGGDTWYWRLLEFGTSKMAARPIMRPALNEKAGAAFDAVAAAMPLEMDKEFIKMGMR